MRRRALLLSVAAPAAFAVMWQVAGERSPSTRLLLSTPIDAAAYLVLHYRELLGDFMTTAGEASLGLLAGAALALTAACAASMFPRSGRLVTSVAVFTQIVPLLTLAPFVIILFGIGVFGKVVMATIVCAFPLYMGLIRSFERIPLNLDALLRVYGASPQVDLWRVRLPLALPNFMTALRVAATLSVVGAIVAEFNGANRGLGRNLFLAAKRLEPELMVVSIVLSAIVSACLYAIVRVVDRRVCYWHHESEVVGQHKE